MNINVTRERPKTLVKKVNSLTEEESTPLKITNINPEFANKVKEAGGATLDYCFQCGTCTGICPWGDYIEFNSRRIIRQAQFGLFDPKSENTWLCTTCLQCLETCPRGVRIPDIMSALRAIALEDGRNIPTTVTNALDSLFENGNPWLRPKRERMDWAKGLDVRILKKKDKIDVVYFVGCTAAYDPRAQNIAKSMVKILNHLDIDWGVLKDEKDCGNCAKTLGEEMLFDALSKDNLKKMKKMEINRIITTSPHSYNAFKLYGLPEDIKIQHYTEFLAEKIKDGSLRFSKKIDKVVTYQDPCYLGRHNKIYDEPRNIIQAIPGIQFVEMKRNRDFSLCCGGGGGRFFQDTPIQMRFANPRVEQALEVGANLMATACYFCLLNFIDATKTLDVEEKIEIKDIAEIVAELI